MVVAETRKAGQTASAVSDHLTLHWCQFAISNPRVWASSAQTHWEEQSKMKVVHQLHYMNDMKILTEMASKHNEVIFSRLCETFIRMTI